MRYFSALLQSRAGGGKNSAYFCSYMKQYRRPRSPRLTRWGAPLIRPSVALSSACWGERMGHKHDGSSERVLLCLTRKPEALQTERTMVPGPTSYIEYFLHRSSIMRHSLSFASAGQEMPAACWRYSKLIRGESFKSMTLNRPYFIDSTVADVHLTCKKKLRPLRALELEHFGRS